MDFDDTAQVPKQPGGRLRGLWDRLPGQRRIYQGLIGDVVYADLPSLGDRRLYKARIVTTGTEAVEVC